MIDIELETSPTVWPVINHTRKNSHHVEIYESERLLEVEPPLNTVITDGGLNEQGNPFVTVCRYGGWIETIKEWRWRLRAGNGAIVSISPDGYVRKRDLVHGLELAHPGFLMLDQNRGLDGGSWYLWSTRLPYEDFLEAGKQATKLVEGVVIPVRVPPKSGPWTSRRPR